MATALARTCEHCGESHGALLWDSTRPDARYGSDACRQAAYRARRGKPDYSDLIGKWFEWYPLDIRDILLGAMYVGFKLYVGEDLLEKLRADREPGKWSRWLVTGVDFARVELRGGPDGWYRRACPVEQFVREATPIDP